MTPDRDGPQASVLGRITTAGVASAVPLPAGSEPLAITSGPDGALWYAAAGRGGGRLGRVLTAPAGEFALPPGSSSARGIVTGPDGALWFTTQQRIGRLVPGAAMTFGACRARRTSRRSSEEPTTRSGSATATTRPCAGSRRPARSAGSGCRSARASARSPPPPTEPSGS